MGYQWTTTSPLEVLHFSSLFYPWGLGGEKYFLNVQKNFYNFIAKGGDGEWGYHFRCKIPIDSWEREAITNGGNLWEFADLADVMKNVLHTGGHVMLDKDGGGRPVLHGWKEDDVHYCCSILYTDTVLIWFETILGVLNKFSLRSFTNNTGIYLIGTGVRGEGGRGRLA